MNIGERCIQQQCEQQTGRRRTYDSMSTFFFGFHLVYLHDTTFVRSTLLSNLDYSSGLQKTPQLRAKKEAASEAAFADVHTYTFGDCKS